MSSSWEVLETDPDLLDKLSQNLLSVEDLAKSLEQRGLLRSNVIDGAGAICGKYTIRQLIEEIVTKDEDSYRRFKRTLIENGEYDAVELLPNVFVLDSQDDVPSARANETAQSLSCTLDPTPDPLPLRSIGSPFSPENSSILPWRSPTGCRESRRETVGAITFPGRPSSPATADLPDKIIVKKARAIKSGPRIYDLTKSPRGLCVIFNNRTFPGFREKDRLGSEFDVERMRILFEAFNFTIEIHRDLPSGEMLSRLAEYADGAAHEGHQAFVLILMSHGGLDHIYGSDYNAVNLQDIFEMFNNFNCPGLREIPKLFFIQACRGDLPDNGTSARDRSTCSADGDQVQSDAGAYLDRGDSGLGNIFPLRSRRISCWSDIYIAYAVVGGYESLRDLRSGSWFLKAVFDVMARHAHAEDLDTLMERVSERVLEKVRTDGQRQCPEVTKIGWRKKLFFNPGLSE
ncbi:caspase-7-like [Galendromus occidentalis]|uniref:Caspase-7-like n=1 Tax=Galendromus occidentalis TaxID=34638 RepID=A0AAJ6VVF4_9ACAR|nr:caspase-7-like [Galendromus occidentalis]